MGVCARMSVLPVCQLALTAKKGLWRRGREPGMGRPVVTVEQRQLAPWWAWNMGMDVWGAGPLLKTFASWRGRR
ncbi:hypothetical protein GCM10010279_68860 [Streptomyces mutabilis]|nr:hypothetical protein GCM10010279_68860 [Streptomyces mutabilis]